MNKGYMRESKGIAASLKDCDKDIGPNISVWCDYGTENKKRPIGAVSLAPKSGTKACERWKPAACRCRPESLRTLR